MEYIDNFYKNEQLVRINDYAINKRKFNAEVFEKMVKEADENGDGEISFSEFKTIMKKFFN